MIIDPNAHGDTPTIARESLAFDFRVRNIDLRQFEFFFERRAVAISSFFRLTPVTAFPALATRANHSFDGKAPSQLRKTPVRRWLRQVSDI
jgi:hypothetical protein